MNTNQQETLEEKTKRVEKELKEKLKEEAEENNKKANSDLYVTLTANEYFNWPNVLKLEKDKPTPVNKTLFDKLMKMGGSFKEAVCSKRIVKGDSIKNG